MQSIDSAAMTPDLERDHEYKMRRLQLFQLFIVKVFNLLIVSVVCVCIYFSIRELAGRQTFADISFRVLANLKANRWLAACTPWGVAILASSWGAGEQYLRKRHVKRVSSESSEMQKKIDSGRRSSSLSKQGDTSAEDR